mmetsp:Transcript_112978/g.217563  ORF Transcript_112978/g.217563 Transcript_112978/m.217563 type:complete len:1254 (+) Transcript_112978:180-3941(+)
MADAEPWHSDEYVRGCGARAVEVVLGSRVGRRSKRDLETLTQFVRARVCFYSTFTPQVLEDICQNLEYKTVSADTILYNAGDHPSHVYLIASGRVQLTYGEQGATHFAEDDEHKVEVERTAPRSRKSVIQRRRLALQGNALDVKAAPPREVETCVNKMRTVMNTMTVTRMAAGLTATAKALAPKSNCRKSKVEEQPTQETLQKDLLEDPGRLHESLLDVIKALATREGSAVQTRTAFLRKAGLVEACGTRRPNTFADSFRSFGRRIDRKFRNLDSDPTKDKNEGVSTANPFAGLKFTAERKEVEPSPVESDKEEVRKPEVRRGSILKRATPDVIQEVITGQMFCLHACVSHIECDNTAKALEDTELLVMNCAKFQAMVEQERTARRLRREQTLVNSVPCLRALDKDKVEKLAESFRSSVHRRGTVLVWEGETRMPNAEDDRLVLLVEGHARAVKAVGPEFEKQGTKSALEAVAESRIPKNSHRAEVERAVAHRDVGVLLPGHVVNGASQLLEIPEPLTVIVDSSEVVVVSCAHADLARAAGSGVLEGLKSATKDLSRWREQRLEALASATPEEIRTRFFAPETSREDEELHLSTPHEKVENWLSQDKTPPALPTPHGEVSATITHRREVQNLPSGDCYVAHGREGTDLPSTPSPATLQDLSMSKPLPLVPGTRGATPASVAIQEGVNLGHVRRIYAIRREDSQTHLKPRQLRRFPTSPGAASPQPLLLARQRSSTPDEKDPPMPGNGAASTFALGVYERRVGGGCRLTMTAPAKFGGTRSGPKGRSPSVSDAIWLPSPYTLRADSVGSREFNNSSLLVDADLPDNHFEAMPELSGFLAQLYEGEEAFKYPTSPRLQHLVSLGPGGIVMEVNPIDPMSVATVRSDAKPPRTLEPRAATAPLHSSPDSMSFMSNSSQPRVHTAPGPIRPPCLPRLQHNRRWRTLKQHSDASSEGQVQVHQVGNQSLDNLNDASWDFSTLTDILPDEQSHYWDDFETTLKPGESTLKPGSLSASVEPLINAGTGSGKVDTESLEQQVMVSKAPMVERKSPDRPSSSHSGGGSKGGFTISVTDAASTDLLFQDSGSLLADTAQVGGAPSNVSTAADEQSIWDQMWSVIGGGTEEEDGLSKDTTASGREEVSESTRGKGAQSLPFADAFPTPPRHPPGQRAPGRPGTFARSVRRPVGLGGRNAEKQVGHRAQEQKRLQSLGEDMPLHVHSIQRFLKKGGSRSVAVATPATDQEQPEMPRSESGSETFE